MDSRSRVGVRRSRGDTTIQRQNLAGRKFGRWTAIEPVHVGNRRDLQWSCVCECGATRYIASSSLLRGHTKSCGCGKPDAIGLKHTTHGMRKTGTYTTWRSIIDRCTQSNHTKWSDYGGRGITVCDRWRRFENFLEDMGTKPESRTIDRIDNDGNYEPGNCRWATRTEQARNTRANRLLTYGGETLTLAEWAERIGVGYATLRSRLDKYGWTIERAIETGDTMHKRIKRPSSVS